MGMPSGLWRCSDRGKTGVVKAFYFAVWSEMRWILWIREKDKKFPKGVFEMLSYRNSFDDSATVRQYFKIGKFHFIFALNI